MKFLSALLLSLTMLFTMGVAYAITPATWVFLIHATHTNSDGTSVGYDVYYDTSHEHRYADGSANISEMNVYDNGAYPTDYRVVSFNCDAAHTAYVQFFSYHTDGTPYLIGSLTRAYFNEGTVGSSLEALACSYD